MSDINDLIAMVQELHVKDARHKRGFLLSERTPMDALLHTIEELTEVGRAKTHGEKTSELGDVLGCLIHYAIKDHIDLGRAAQSALKKLPRDFPDPLCQHLSRLSDGARWECQHCGVSGESGVADA